MAGTAMLASDELLGVYSVDPSSYDGAVAICVSMQRKLWHGQCQAETDMRGTAQMHVMHRNYVV